MARMRRKQRRIPRLVVWALGVGLVALLAVSWRLREAPPRGAAIEEMVPADLFALPREKRVGTRWFAQVEIMDDFSPGGSGSRIVSARVGPRERSVPVGLKIPSRLVPPDLQKRQLYRCEMVVDDHGFLEVLRLEKD